MIKKVCISLLILWVSTANATELGLGKRRFGAKITFDKGTLVSQFGVGIFPVYKTSRSSMVVPPLYAAIEYGVTNRIGIGALVGFYTTLFRESNSIYAADYSYTHLIAQIRGAYHIIHRDQMDFYVGVGAGYVLMNSNIQVKTSISTVRVEDAEKLSTPLALSIYAGFRYYFTNRLGVFGEAGYSISFLSGGLIYRFQ